MSAANRTRLIRNGAIAAIVGSTVGGAIGVWSLRHPGVTVTAVTTAAPARAVTTATETANRPAADVIAGSPPTQPQPPARAPQPADRRTSPAARPAPVPVTATKSAAAPSPSAGAAEDDAQVLQRARALARRPDVAALIALRESVARRAAERGRADAPSIRSELDELDQRLNEARTLQLKLDAEELRKAESKRPR
jgi:hypothetical protein